MKELPDLHKQAFVFKNTKRLQHDGGRAWIKDSQLQEARKGANGRLVTLREKKGRTSNPLQSAGEGRPAEKKTED
ncbi:MAG: hypothetical protein WEC12_06515 [Balneolaceae bacterium]